MAFNIRIFGHRGLSQIPAILPQQRTSDTVYQLTEPAEFQQLLVADAVAVQSAPVADANPSAAVTVLWIEVPDNKAIRYEITPAGQAVRVAGNTSKRMTGSNAFYFRSNYVLSIIDAAALP